MSPLDEPIPEGFGRIEPSLEKSHTLQTFVFRCTDANGTYKKFYPNCIPELLIFEIKDFFCRKFPARIRGPSAGSQFIVRAHTTHHWPRSRRASFYKLQLKLIKFPADVETFSIASIPYAVWIIPVSFAISILNNGTRDDGRIFTVGNIPTCLFPGVSPEVFLYPPLLYGSPQSFPSFLFSTSKLPNTDDFQKHLADFDLILSNLLFLQFDFWNSLKQPPMSLKTWVKHCTISHPMQIFSSLGLSNAKIVYTLFNHQPFFFFFLKYHLS